ncbi:MAG: hypothetical protein J0I47_03910 [Sphingomonas sp.]|uniref:hypothetical protein n=1 Tax=Sphingomonas sp. TaxID=28214 RepID=UPI001ACD7F52|nr:hypothetical protein [Sphingomonas sp.]MBN8807371.1 hypothetical protein [Sphingomonas sp.]
MSDPLPPTPAERAEAAATRRRWLNLGEFVAVAGLIIAAISLWLSWHDRKADEADKQATQAAEAKDRSRYDVRWKMRGKDVVLTADDRHQLGDISVTFPTDLGIGTQTSATQTIAGDWYRGALLKATKDGPGRQTGKLPILLTVNYMDGDKPMSTTGVFDIVWEAHGVLGTFVRGRDLNVSGMRLHERGGSQTRIDALWKTDKPAS